MHLRCQTPLCFAPLSVAKSWRYRCRDLQHWKDRRKSLRRDVDNCHHHFWNQHLTPAVAESTAPVVKPLTFPAAIPLRALHLSQTRTTPECPSPTAGAKRRPARACRRRNPLVDLNPHRAISVHSSSAARFPSPATENPPRTSPPPPLAWQPPPMPAPGSRRPAVPPVCNRSRAAARPTAASPGPPRWLPLSSARWRYPAPSGDRRRCSRGPAHRYPTAPRQSPFRRLGPLHSTHTATPPGGTLRVPTSSGVPTRAGIACAVDVAVWVE